jgi:hypothetical protein
MEENPMKSTLALLAVFISTSALASPCTELLRERADAVADAKAQARIHGTRFQDEVDDQDFIERFKDLDIRSCRTLEEATCKVIQNVLLHHEKRKKDVDVLEIGNVHRREAFRQKIIYRGYAWLWVKQDGSWWQTTYEADVNADCSGSTPSDVTDRN